MGRLRAAAPAERPRRGLAERVIGCLYGEIQAQRGYNGFPPMTDTSPTAPRTSVAHAICAYAEPLAVGRRIVVVGDASLDLGGWLADAGARAVHVYDPLAERARAHVLGSRVVTVRPLPDGEFDVRDGAFDLAIVPDLAQIADPAALLSRLRKLVGADGAVLIAANNPESPRNQAAPASSVIEYAELYDLVALQFASVRMIAQVPFVGVTLAELGEQDEEPEVSVDTQLVTESDVPDMFVALGSQRDARLGAYAIVQLPHLPEPDERPAQVATPDPSAIKELKALKDEIEHKRDRIAALEQALRAAEDAGAAQQQRAHEAERLAQRSEQQLAVLASEFDAVRAAIDVPQIDPAAVDSLARRAENAELQLSAVEAELAGIADAHSGELAALEARLLERAGVIQEAETEIRRRERLVRELVSSLEEAHARAHEPSAVEASHTESSSPTQDAMLQGAAKVERENVELREKLDRLAVQVAQREGEIQSQAWRIAELEYERSKGSVQKSSNKDAELDALRQALTQEHDARSKVESGAELSKARAELARQATLIEQLSRELETRERLRLAEQGSQAEHPGPAR